MGRGRYKACLGCGMGISWCVFAVLLFLVYWLFVVSPARQIVLDLTCPDSIANLTPDEILPPPTSCVTLDQTPPPFSVLPIGASPYHKETSHQPNRQSDSARIWHFLLTLWFPNKCTPVRRFFIPATTYRLTGQRGASAAGPVNGCRWWGR